MYMLYAFRIRASTILCTFLLADHSITRVATGHGDNSIEMQANVNTLNIKHGHSSLR